MQSRYRVTSVTHPKNDLQEYVNPHTALKYADALIEDGFEPLITTIAHNNVSGPLTYDDLVARTFSL